MKDEVGQSADGFGNDDGFDSFLAMGPPPPPQVNISYTSILILHSPYLIQNKLIHSERMLIVMIRMTLTNRILKFM